MEHDPRPPWEMDSQTDFDEILHFWCDNWAGRVVHQAKKLGQEPDVVAGAQRPGIDSLLDVAVAPLMRTAGSVSNPHDDEVARVGIVSLLNVRTAALAAVQEGVIGRAHLGAIECAVAFAAVPWLHVLGYEPCQEKLAELVPPPLARGECTGCGTAIFGALVERGFCLACLPSAEDAKLLLDGPGTTAG